MPRPSSPRVLLFKVLQRSFLLLNSFYYRLKFSLVVSSLGKGLITEGCVRFSAVNGDIRLGNHIRFGPDVRLGVDLGATLTIGNSVSVNQGTFIIACSSVEIGNYCRIGEGVSIRDNDHAWEDAETLIKDQGFVTKPVKIGDDVWIGRGVVISKGVTIGDGAVIGANAVVTQNIPAYSVAVGVPAKVIKKRGV